MRKGLSKFSNHFVWFGITACLSAVVLGQSLTIQLKSGDKITGALLSESSTNLVVNHPVLGKLTVPLGDIEKRLTNAPALVQKTNTPPPVAAPKPAPAPVVVVKPAPPPAPPKPKPWIAEFQFGLNLRYTTKEQEDFFTTAKVSYNVNKLRNVADYGFTYGKTEGVLSANRLVGTIKSDYDLSKRVYVYNLMGAGYDEIRKIDIQYEVGPGFGVQLLVLTNFVLKGELGVSYQEQFRSDNTDQMTYSARFAQIFTWKISDRLVTDAKLEYFPNLERVEHYRLRMEAIIKYALLKNLSVNLNLIDLYDTLPASGVDKNDLQIRSALGLKF
jgi:hypothetical protein